MRALQNRIGVMVNRASRPEAFGPKVGYRSPGRPGRSGWWLAGIFVALSLSIFLQPQSARAQGAVDVTLTLDKTRVFVGDTATLRVYGQIDPTIEVDTDRIFSWYIDVLNSNGLVATADWNNLVTSFSDNNPLTSDDGKISGHDCVGVYDTFLNRASAGKGAPVELLRVTVTAVALGSVEFTARAGTTVKNLSNDFVVARSGGGTPFTGGDYGAASVTLDVIDIDGICFEMERQANGDVVLTFLPVSGKTHVVQYNDSAALDDAMWVDLSFPPHNSGSKTDVNPGVASRFYRVLVSSP